MNNKILVKLSGLSLLFCLAIYNPHNSFAQDTTAKQLFYQGNSAYKEAKFEAAIDNYEQVVGMGWESGNLYYNLGNSYFKKGELGKAVFNYEKALFFIPYDSDLKSNYEYVLASLNLKEQFFGNWLVRLSSKLFNETTVNFLTIFLCGIYIIAILGLICNVFFKGINKGIKILFSVLIVLFTLSAIALNNKVTYLNKGVIVIGKEVDAKFEPLEGATTYFKLAQGSKVEILEKSENWCKIKRPDGKIGWVDKKELGLMNNAPE